MWGGIIDEAQRDERLLKEAIVLMTAVANNKKIKDDMMRWLKSNFPNNCLSCGESFGEAGNFCRHCGAGKR